MIQTIPFKSFITIHFTSFIFGRHEGGKIVIDDKSKTPISKGQKNVIMLLSIVNNS